MTPGNVKSMAAPAAIPAELAVIAGEPNVWGDAAQLEMFAVDDVVPAAAVSPASAEEVAAILRMANDRGWVVVPAGGFTAQAMGRTPPRIDVVLRTNRLSQVLHYDPADLTLGVGAGMTLSETGALLTARGQMLPLDPPQPHRATIGGLLATSAHGPLRHGYGSVRDYCIGIQFVTGDGVIAKGGGRVVKNVAGYDLMKLLIGSQGTLGVIVSANFKVMPRPRQTRTFVAEFAGPSEAVAFRDFVVRSPLTPMCLEIVSPYALAFLDDSIAPRSPDQHVPEAPPAPPSHWTVLLRAAGSDAVLARYRRELGDAVTRELDGEPEARTWQRISDFGVRVLERHQNAMIAHIGSTIQGVAASLAAFEKAALDYNFLPAAVGRCAVGSLVAAFVPLAVDPPSAVNFAASVSALRGTLPDGASAVVARCPAEAKHHFDVWGTELTDVASMRAVRAAMDPNSVLNRGRFAV